MVRRSQTAAAGMAPSPSRSRQVSPGPAPPPSRARAMSGPTTRPTACAQKTRPIIRPRLLWWAYSLISTALTG
jgi:hypothetical protein